MAATLNQLSTIKRERVLDVGCGGCELSRDLLRHKFKEIDFLDSNVEAIKISNAPQTRFQFGKLILQLSNVELG